MNGYDLTERMRKTRRRYHLSAATQALYHELVAICNEEGWVDTFECSNDELCSSLKITEKSLIDYRVNLIQAGLVYYKSGKSKKSIGVYSFIKEVNGCKIYSQSGSQSYSQSGKKTPDYNKDKLKQKQKLNSNFSAPQADAPKEEFSKVLFWKKFVEVWNDFYQVEKKQPYSYQKKDFSCLKKIYDFLKKRSELKNYEWTEENMVSGFTFFLKKAIQKDGWMNQNFSIPNVLSQFNQIANGESNNKTGHSQPTGANVSTGSILNKIAGMPD